jgi:hypothetical protein
MKFTQFATFLCLVLISACSSTSGDSIRLQTGYRIGIGKVSPKTKIFLIAGSKDNANFAQEVIDQMKFWKAQGYSKDEIACYYVPPMKVDDNDLKQFETLFSELRDCYFAEPKAIFENIKSVASSRPNEVYVYVSSHGSKPLSSYSYNFKNQKFQESVLKALTYPKWANAYAMEVDGFIESSNDFWTYDNISKAATFAQSNPDAADDFLFTPSGLRKALMSLPSSTKKVVVLQGCHTGGFVLPATQVGAENTLNGIENATVLTASSAERTSFGCDSGSHTTFFGEAYMTSLQKSAVKKKISQVDWKEVYDSTHTKVMKKEAAVGRAKTDYSKPQFYVN